MKISDLKNLNIENNENNENINYSNEQIRFPTVKEVKEMFSNENQKIKFLNSKSYLEEHQR